MRILSARIFLSLLAGKLKFFKPSLSSERTWRKKKIISDLAIDKLQLLKKLSIYSSEVFVQIKFLQEILCSLHLILQKFSQSVIFNSLMRN